MQRIPKKLRAALVTLLQALLSLAVLLASLAGFELLLRTDFVFETLPVPRPYYTYDVTRKLHALRELRRERGPMDVLFIGSSVVRADIQPSRFDRRVQQLTGRPVVSFNFGMSKMFPNGAVLYLEHLLLDRARPRIVVHGVREAELASRQARPYYLRRGRVEPLWQQNTWRSKAEAFLIQELTLLQQRGVLRRSLVRLGAGEPVHRFEKGEIRTNERGYRAERSTLRAARRRNSKRLWKYGKRLRSNRYRYALPAIDRMNAACKEAGAIYVLLHLPEHPDRFSGKLGPATWKDYQKRVRKLAAQRGIPFIDVTDGDLQVFAEDSFYADYHHMRAPGAAYFTELVATRMAPMLAGER